MPENTGKEGFALTSKIANKAFTMKGWILAVPKITLWKNRVANTGWVLPCPPSQSAHAVLTKAQLVEIMHIFS